MTKMAQNIFKRLWFRRAGIAFVHDMLAAIVSLPIAFYLRVGNDILDPKYLDILMVATPIYAGVAAISFWACGLYRGLWRYASIKDMNNILKGSLLSIIAYLPVFFIFNRLEGFPRTVPIIQLMIVVAILGGSRTLYRMIWRRYFSDEFYAHDKKNRIPVLLYGAGDGAELFIRASQKGPSNYEVVGIIDDRRLNKGRTIHGVKVLGGTKDFDKVIEKLSRKEKMPQRLIFTLQEGRKDTTDGTLMRKITECAEANGLTLSRLPRLENFRKIDDAKTIELQPIAIEDLLGRPQKVLNKQQVEQMLTNKRILITGAGGSIGSELCRQIMSFKPDSLMLLDNGEHNLYQIKMSLNEQNGNTSFDVALCDIRDRDRLAQIFDRYHPEVVFHAAAYKHVPMIESNPAEGVLTNAIGTRNVADACKVAGVEAMIQISTDKAVNPTNVMGATKKLAEYYCQSLDLDPQCKTRYATVRFGNVLGSSGSVVPLFERQLKSGGPLTVTDPNIERFFMTIPEAVGLVLSASAYGINPKTNKDDGPIFVLDMGEPIKIDEVARQMIRLAGYVPDQDIKIVYTGLRPGEKMYEELFNTGESIKPTELEGIQIAEPDPIERQVLIKAIKDLEAAARINDEAWIMRLLRQYVPGYTNEAADFKAVAGKK